MDLEKKYVDLKNGFFLNFISEDLLNSNRLY